MRKDIEKRLLSDNRTHVPADEMPYDTGRNNDWHRHRCQRCGVQWAHDGRVDRPPIIHDAGHVCPGCGGWALVCEEPEGGYR